MISTPAKSCVRKILRTRKNFTNTKKFYEHEIAAVDLSKIYFHKNALKTCKPNNRDLNHDWKIRWLGRAFSSCLLRAIIARNHLPFFKILSNFVHFCLNVQIFCPFLPFFVKNRKPLLSRIGPARKSPTHVNLVILYKNVFSVKLSILWH